MPQVAVNEESLTNIANAIRSKKGGTDRYTPGQMAGAINGIKTADEVVLVQKSITANGTYNPEGDSADGYSGVSVDVANSYTSSDNGKVVSNQQLVAQTSKQIIQNGTHDTTTNNSVSVAVPNSYSSSDNGKVVVNQALVAQTSRNVTVNGTYDTTNNNEVVVNVPTGGGSGTLIPKTVTQNGTYNASADNADGYSQVTVNVSGSGGSSDAFMTADFTKGSFSFGNVDYGPTGAIFNGITDWIPLILPQKNDVTVEIDVAMMQLTSGSHRRFIMGSSSDGLIYKSNGKWAFYASGWVETEITDGSYFDGTTVGVYIDTNNYWHIYKDGNLVCEPTSALALNLVSYAGILLIGSNNSNTINNARITGARAYLGNHYGQ